MADVHEAPTSFRINRKLIVSDSDSGGVTSIGDIRPMIDMNQGRQRTLDLKIVRSDPMESPKVLTNEQCLPSIFGPCHHGREIIGASSLTMP
jgi:hypothetical protein